MFQCHLKYQRSGNIHKDRFAGVAKEAKGAIMETVGMAVGDAKLTAEGQIEKAVGKLQNAVGGAKEPIRKV